MALFQFWNINRFSDIFFINRDEMMQLSKIGAKATYHRCLRSLHDWGYIRYFPSHNPYKGSKVKMLIFGTTNEQAENGHETSSEQALVPYLNNYKQNKTLNKPKLPKSEVEVIDFFLSQQWPTLEAMKFYNHYQSIGWKIGGRAKITDWRATANNWMLKAKELESTQKNVSTGDNLRTTTNKSYDEPL